MRRTLLVGVLLFLPVVLSAQWFRIRTTGVPRLPSGAPNLKAPAPRTADDHPDLSGIWIADNPLPCPPLLRDGDDCLEKMPLSKEAYNIAATLPGGLPHQPWAAALESATELVAAALSEDHSDSRPGRDAERVQRELPPDLHRRPCAASRSAAVLDRLLRGALGRRRAGRRHH